MTYENMEIKKKYYKFTITNPDTSATGSKVGFIDSMKAQDYQDYDPTSGTLDQYTAKAMGYIRWLNLSLELSKFGVFYLDVNSLTGSTSVLTPTKLIFTMGFEQAENMYIKVDNTEYKGVDALKYLVGFVMTNNYKMFAQVYDPTLDTQGRNPSGAAIGLTEPYLTAGKLCDNLTSAYNYITIEELGKLTIKTVPTDATVTLTATGYTQEGNSISVPLNTSVAWSVSKTGYTTKSGTETVTGTKNLTVEL